MKRISEMHDKVVEKITQFLEKRIIKAGEGFSRLEVIVELCLVMFSFAASAAVVVYHSENYELKKNIAECEATINDYESDIDSMGEANDCLSASLEDANEWSRIQRSQLTNTWDKLIATQRIERALIMNSEQITIQGNIGDVEIDYELSVPVENPTAYDSPEFIIVGNKGEVNLTLGSTSGEIYLNKKKQNEVKENGEYEITIVDGYYRYKSVISFVDVEPECYNSRQIIIN